MTYFYNQLTVCVAEQSGALRGRGLCLGAGGKPEARKKPENAARAKRPTACPECCEGSGAYHPEVLARRFVSPVTIYRTLRAQYQALY